MMLMPNKGRLLINKGNTAQWMAQAKEAPTPNASQLILKFMSLQMYKIAILLQILFSCNFPPLPVLTFALNYEQEDLVLSRIFCVAAGGVLSRAVLGHRFMAKKAAHT